MVERTKTTATLLGYLKREISFNYLVDNNPNFIYNEKQNRILTIMKTPRELEKLILFGVCICLNSFLFVFTFLPLRLLSAVLHLIHQIITCQRNWVLSSHKCDFAKILLLLLCTMIVQFVDTSQVYHLVRGQSVIKLYVIYNVLEIFDRLASSIGQDVLDSFYYVLSNQPFQNKNCLPFLFYTAVATVYVLIHSMLILCQAITINVAINSHSKALFTVMVSNQFVELKGSVFKKFDVKNVFQLSCSDIRERFHYIILLLIVTLRNMAQFNWNVDQLGTMLTLIILIFISEIFVDWIKHGFITKFNGISPDEYQKYNMVLANDLIAGNNASTQSEYSDLVSRRIGFTPLPLACILTQTLYGFASFPGISGKVFMFLCFICLVSVKILLGIIVLGLACRIADDPNKGQSLKGNLSKLTREPTPPEIRSRFRKTESVDTLKNVERFEMVGSRII